VSEHERTMSLPVVRVYSILKIDELASVGFLAIERIWIEETETSRDSAWNHLDSSLIQLLRNRLHQQV
jgi:hypothetical protein